MEGGNDRGGWGDTMGRITNCHYYCHCVMLCYVNIYHKNVLFGGLLKVIVLHCIVLN